MNDFNVLVLGGDHIGPEVATAGVQVLKHTANYANINVTLEEGLIGGASWNKHGTYCTDDVLRKVSKANATLVGAVGGPEWDDKHHSGSIIDSDGLMRLRIELDLYNALRPIRSWKPLVNQTPYRPEVIKDTDLLIVRENCGGIYVGEPRGRDHVSKTHYRAYETCEYNTMQIERIARSAFEMAQNRRKQVTSLDKSNVLESGKLWRETVDKIGNTEYPDIKLTHLLMDYALFAVNMNPYSFDVLLADNLFGDLMSDMTGAIAGSLGMLPSATLPTRVRKGHQIRGGVYEPTHGSAPDISGKGIANPIGTILSVAMMFEYAFCRSDLSQLIELAVEKALFSGFKTPDLGGDETTQSVADAICANIN